MLQRNVDKYLLALSISLPFILILLFPNSYHYYDVPVFIDWAKYSDSFSELYGTTCRCNYPAIGLYLSTWVIKFLGFNITLFRIYLACFDAAIILLLFKFLRDLKVPKALLYAAIIGLLPSSWVGTSLWGQIDNIAQFFLLATLYFIYKTITQQFVFSKLLIRLFLIGVAINIMLLTKQLLFFSVVSIGVFILIIIFQQIKSKPQIILAFVITLLGVYLPLALIDSLLTFNPDYFTHIQRVLFDYHGSDHMNKIAGNGFNIWIYLGRDFLSSSEIPYWKFLTPKNTGLFLYISYMVVITTIVFYVAIKRNLKQVGLFLYVLFYLALTNLGFNLLISGTHERYLIHFYPYISIVILGLYYKNTRLFVINLVLASVYGIFVLTILDKISIVGKHQFVGLLHLIYFFYLSFLFYKRSRVTKIQSLNE